MIEANSKESCIQAIKSIGQELIEKAEDIANDVKNVTSIKIDANITADEIVVVNITKQYVPKFLSERR